jgi:uncharacterized protein
MGKLALLALAVIAALLWFRYKAGAESRAARARDQASARPQVERMVRCANCGVHLPAGEASLDAQGEVFCTPAHRSAGKRAS